MNMKPDPNSGIVKHIIKNNSISYHTCQNLFYCNVYILGPWFTIGNSNLQVGKT